MKGSDFSRRVVATLIVLLLVLRLGSWLWSKHRELDSASARTALQRKIAASKAYDDALLRAETLLTRADTVAAAHMLDSLQQVPTDSLFPIERQKLTTLKQRLDGMPIESSVR